MDKLMFRTKDCISNQGPKEDPDGAECGPLEGPEVRAACKPLDWLGSCSWLCWWG